MQIRTILGLALVAAAGAVVYYAWRENDLIYWCVGALTLVSALLFIRSGALASAHPITETSAPSAPRFTVQEEAIHRPPLLGELLVHKYRRISSDTLAQALEVQRGSTRPLGDVLLAMGEINQNDLDLALSDQERYKDGSWVNEPWAMRRIEARPNVAVLHSGQS